MAPRISAGPWSHSQTRPRPSPAPRPASQQRRSSLLTPAGPADVVVGWGDGLSGLLAFITQMALVLMLGHILANTGPVRR
ncbi:MAG: hypothetical protein DI545_08750, partial [Micrococcus luteus]